MANAKYAEDIVRRYTEENYERINAVFSGRDFDREWKELSRIESAAVAAKINGKFFEDKTVFLRNAKIQFSVVCSSKKQPVSASYTKSGKALEVLSPNDAGCYCLTDPQEDGILE